MPAGSAKIPSCADCATRITSCFSVLNEEDTKLLDATKETTFFLKGQNIFYSGRTPTGVYCLFNGKVKMSRSGTDGKDQIVRFVLPGKLLGIRAFLSNCAYSSTATVLEDSTICYIPKELFVSFQTKYPSITTCMLYTLSQMLQRAEEKMTSIAQKNVRERLAETLLELHNIFSFGNCGNNGINPITLKRDDIANIVGTATETVVRLLHSFKDEGIIVIEGRKIFVMDVPQLKNISKGIILPHR
jgi:CRP/FNR family transcriptional regulator